MDTRKTHKSWNEMLYLKGRMCLGAVRVTHLPRHMGPTVKAKEWCSCYVCEMMLFVLRKLKTLWGGGLWFYNPGDEYPLGNSWVWSERDHCGDGRVLPGLSLPNKFWIRNSDCCLFFSNKGGRKCFFHSVSLQRCCSVIYLSTLLNFPFLRILHSRLVLTR